MKVDPRAIAGIEAKIDRAHQHLGTLHHEMVAWDAEKPWRLAYEVHDDGRKHFFRLCFLKPIPVDWAVLLGEAVHDLRSALEQCVFWLTIDWCGKDIGGTAFPVYTKRSGFLRKSQRDPSGWARDGGMYKIRGIGPGPQAFIEALQPYPQRRDLHSFEIGAINALWNQDKHRLVHLWGLRFSDHELRINSKAAPDSTILLDRRVLHDRAIAMKVVCDPPHDQVQVGGEATAAIALHLNKRKGGGTRHAWDMERIVVDVIRKLTCAIGDQRSTITTDVWTAAIDGPPY